jgi:hypothetical protein
MQALNSEGEKIAIRKNRFFSSFTRRRKLKKSDFFYQLIGCFFVPRP